MSTIAVGSARILVVDDEPANVDLLLTCLATAGYVQVLATLDSREVLDLHRSFRPDLILLDLHMPRLDGFAVLDLLGEEIQAEEYLPILVLTADISAETKRRALSSGAKDFLTKPLDITEVLLRIRNLLETRFLHQQQRLARARAEGIGRRALFLAEASHLLASSFDYHTTLGVFCRTLVPELADFCAIDVLDDDGTVSRVGGAHVDPALEPLVLRTPFVDGMPEDHPVLMALRQGRATLATNITTDVLEAIAGQDGDLSVIEQLAPRSAIIVPLLASARIHGALVLVNSSSGRSFDDDDMELARELARRAALTIENARLYNQAQEATRARDQMLAVVAHDLRNPLSTIAMGSEVLQEQLLEGSQKNIAEMVGRAAEQMRRLIDDLLEISRIERGRLRLEVRAERLLPIVNESVAMLRPLATSAGVLLYASPSDDLPPALIDGTRVLQVLSNLVGNAIKFTPAGGEVRISTHCTGDQIMVEVADTGPGIPPEQIPHLFTRYWQASDTDTRGIGLGLSIVRGIVQGHGGEIWVESEPGRGSTFYFTLPLAMPDADDLPNMRATGGVPLPSDPPGRSDLHLMSGL